MERQERWLNNLSDEGWRLVRVGKLSYEFEPCPPGAYRYRVDFVGHLPAGRQKDYRSLLRELGYRVMSKNLNLNWSAGHVRFRPWAKGAGKLSASPGSFNRELLIIEKENDGAPFELHTAPEDLREYYRYQRNMYATTALLGLAFALVLFYQEAIAGGTAFAVLAVLCGLPVVWCRKRMGETQ